MALASAQEIAVDLVCAHWPEDLRFVTAASAGTPCRCVAINASVQALLPEWRHPHRLPFLQQIIYAGYLHGKGKYLIYTNIDIGVQPPFYIKIAHQLQLHPEVLHLTLTQTQRPFPTPVHPTASFLPPLPLPTASFPPLAYPPPFPSPLSSPPPYHTTPRTSTP